MQKGNIVFLLVLISGLVIGGFIGDVLGRVPFFAWLNYGQTIGLEKFDLNLGFLSFSLSFMISLTIAGIIGMVTAIILYKKL